MELAEMSEAWGLVERTREKEMWRRFSFLAAEIINVSGKVAKRAVKATDLVRFPEDRVHADRERRRGEALETLRKHKAKCWTKLKDESIGKLTEN